MLRDRGSVRERDSGVRVSFAIDDTEAGVRDVDLVADLIYGHILFRSHGEGCRCARVPIDHSDGAIRSGTTHVNPVRYRVNADSVRICTRVHLAGGER